MKVFPFLFVFMTLINLGLRNASAMQTVDDIKHAMWLGKSGVVFSPILHWLTLEPLKVKGGSDYYVANSFNPSSYCGEIAIYPSVNKINKLVSKSNDYGYFSEDATIPPLFHLPYEYVLDSCSYYFMLENGNSMLNDVLREEFFLSLSVNYFLNNFLERTNVSSVFSTKGGVCLFEKEEDKEGNPRKVRQRNETEEKQLRKRYRGNEAAGTTLRKRTQRNEAEERKLRKRYRGNEVAETTLRKRTQRNETEEMTCTD